MMAWWLRNWWWSEGMVTPEHLKAIREIASAAKSALAMTMRLEVVVSSRKSGTEKATLYTVIARRNDEAISRLNHFYKNKYTSFYYNAKVAFRDLGVETFCPNFSLHPNCSSNFTVIHLFFEKIKSHTSCPILIPSPKGKDGCLSG